MAEQIGLAGVFDLSNFDKGIASYIQKMKQADDTTENTRGRLGVAFDNMGSKVLNTAQTMGTVFATAALAAGAAVGAFVASGISKAGDLQEQMGGIAALMGKTRDEILPLKDLILDLGLDPTLKVNATEAADAIQKLASNGLTMTQIMDGAAKATVLLANSTDADFGTAAAIATDSMALFNIKAEDMMRAVNGITGVTVASKFEIGDYQLALAQSGAVAAASGVEFGDFNTTIAAISNSFASGSDAGTSFKTFLTRLTPDTEAATGEMMRLGLMTEDGSNQFYDAAGNLKSMSEISGILSNALAGLTEEQKNTTLSTLYGSDASRAALAVANASEVSYTDQALAAKELGVSFDSLTGVMSGGITKFEAMQAVIGNTDAVKSASVRMDTFKGSMEILWGVIDSVSIRIGDIFLPVLQRMAERFAELVTVYSPQIIGFFEDVSAAITAFASGSPGDFPWEDIFPPWLAVTAYALSSTIESLGIVLSDFNAGLIGQDYPWEDVFPSWLSDIIYLISENSTALVGALAGVGAVLAAAGIAAAMAAVGVAMAAVLSPLGLLVIGAAALGAAWNTNFLGIKDATLAVLEPIGSYITAIMDAGVFSIEAREALTLLPEALQGIVGGIVETVASITNFVSAILDAGITSTEAREALGLLATSFWGLVTSIAALYPLWVAQLLEWASAIGEQLLSIDYIALGTSILTSIMSGWTAAVALVSPTITAWGVSIGTTLDAIDWPLIGTTILDSIVAGWTAAVALATPTIMAFGTSIGTTLNAIDWLQVGKDILAGIQSGIEAGKALALAAVTLIASSFKDQFGDSIAGWKIAGEGILTSIRTGIEAGKAATLIAVQGIATSIRDRYVTPEGFDWNTVGSDLTKAISTGITTASNAAGGIIAVTYALATEIKNQFTTLSWGEIGTLIIDTIKAAMTAAAAAAGGLLAEALAIGQRMVTAITEIDFEEVGKGIARSIKDGFKLLAEGVGGLIPTATTVGTSVSTAFSDIDWNALGLTIINGIAAGVRTAAYAAAGILFVVAEIVTGMIDEFFGVDWELNGQTILQDIQAGMETAKTAFFEMVGKIPTAIVAVFTDSVKAFKGIGSDIVAGISTGFWTKWEEWIQTIKDAADILPDFIKKPLGISSPSKVFAQIGKDVVNGLIQGLQSRMEVLHATVKQIVASMGLKELLSLEITESFSFTDRLRTQILIPMDAAIARSQELKTSIAEIEKELSKNISREDREGFFNQLNSMYGELANIAANGAPPELDHLRNVLGGTESIQGGNKLLSQQLDLLKEAKSLGLDSQHIALGDVSISNLIKMAELEQTIAQIKQQQLGNQLLQIRRGVTQEEQIGAQVAFYNETNRYLEDQVSLLKQAYDLGIDTSRFAVGNSLDPTQSLKLQEAIAIATNNELRNRINLFKQEADKADKLSDALRLLQPLINQTNVNSAFGQRYKTTVLDPILEALKEAAGIDSERLRLINEYTVAAQKLVELGKKEEQLDFLKQQLDIISMIKDQDIPGGNSLFDGLTLGINASITDLVNLTSRVLDGLITQVKAGLGIHSPSSVFAEIGMQMMAGLGQGIQQGMINPLRAMRDATFERGSVSTRTLNLAMGGVTINTPMDEIQFESRVLRIMERAI